MILYETRPCVPCALRRAVHGRTHARPISAAYDLLAHSKRAPASRFADRMERSSGLPFHDGATRFGGRAQHRRSARVGAHDRGVLFLDGLGSAEPLTFVAASPRSVYTERSDYRQDRFHLGAVKILGFPDPKRLPSPETRNAF